MYMESYMADYGQGFMVSRNFCQAHLQEVGLAKLLETINFFILNLPNFKTYCKVDSRLYKHHQVILNKMGRVWNMLY